MTFTLSIEHTAGNSQQYGFHLGTIESIARQIVEEKMAWRVQNGRDVVTMALIQKGKVFDVLYPDGKWHSQIED